MQQAEIDRGARPGLTSEERRRIAELERENRELRRANEILRSAAAFFGAELDAAPPGDPLRRRAQGLVRGRADLPDAGDRPVELKAELIARAGRWRTVEQVELATAEWGDFWNTRRLHSACGDVPPAEFEASYHQRQAEAVAPDSNRQGLHETQGGSASSPPADPSARRTRGGSLPSEPV